MSDYKVPELLRIISIASVALPLFSYIIKYRYLSKPLHFIGALAFVSASSDVAALKLFADDSPTIVVFNIYYLLLFVLLASFYYNVFEMKNDKRLVWAAGIIYSSGYTINLVLFQNLNQYHTHMWTLSGIIMMVFSVLYFLYLFSRDEATGDYSLLWINSGVLFYFCFNLFLFIMSSYVLTEMNREISMVVWTFHNVNNVIKNIMFAIGLLVQSRRALATGLA